MTHLKYRFFIKRVLIKILNILFKLTIRINFSTYRSTLSNRSFDSMSSVIFWMIDGINQKYSDFSIKDKKIIEIGSGQFLSHPLCLKALCAESIVSIDLHRQFNQAAALLSWRERTMSKKIYSKYITSLEYSKNIAKIDETKLDLKELEKIGVKYIAPFDFNHYKEDNLFDLVISYTVLEHVPVLEVLQLLNKSIDVLKPSGVFCHFIDLEDHKDSSRPFDFLAEKIWSDKDSFSRGNRLRLDDWDDIFSKIKDIEYEFVSILQKDKNLLPIGVQKKFSNYSTGILVVGKKNGKN